MPTNTAEKHIEVVTRAPRAGATNDRMRRIMARSRYQAPAVLSYPISGCEQSGPLSMIGNNTEP